ncbi:MAG: T9SS type A sorting domain-containing protein [Bacteroidota bacterium]
MTSNFTLKKQIKTAALLLMMFVASLAMNAQDIIRVSIVDPQSDLLVLSNFGSTTVDVGVYWLCLGPGTYVQVSNAALTNTNLGPGESVTISYNVDPIADGFSLFSTNNFSSSDPSILLDYVQWGAGDQPRVDQAVTAGRWDDADNFVSGPAPYAFFGGPGDFGSTFWITPLNTEDSFESNLKIFPNPVVDDLIIQIPDGSRSNLSLEVFDISGRKVIAQSINGELNLVISVRDLQSGVYLLNIVGDSEVLMSRKIVVK